MKNSKLLYIKADREKRKKIMDEKMKGTPIKNKILFKLEIFIEIEEEEIQEIFHQQQQ
mgnify:CR=1 FL=1